MKTWLYSIFIFISFSLLAADEFDFKKMADDLHRRVSGSLQSRINYIDQFFLSETELDKDSGTRIFLFDKTSYTNRGSLQNEIDLKFSLRLPTISKSLQLSFEGNKKKDFEKKSSQNEINIDKSAGSQEGDGYTGQLSYFKMIKDILKYKATTGITVERTPQPFAKALFYNDLENFGLELKPSLEFKWQSGPGFTQAAGFSIGRRLNSKIFARWHNNQSWSNSNDVLAVSIGPSLNHHLTDRKAINYNFRFDYENRPNFQLKEYRFNVGFRQNLHKNWFYFDVGPFVSFAREQNFKQDHGAFLKLELAIGSL